MMLPVLDPRLTREVPCGTCSECCKNDAVFLHPECGDDPADYQTEEYQGRRILAHKPNGDCIYLGDKGCTIHARRPAICREMDCRKLVYQLGPKQMERLGLGALTYAARRLRKHGTGSAAKKGV